MRTRKEPPTKEEILRMLASGEVYTLPTAEVEGQFVPQTKEEADAYRNLGVEGALQMRDMQRSVTGARNRFAEEAMVPAAEAVMTAEGITSLPALARLLTSPRVLAKLLANRRSAESAKSAEMARQKMLSRRDKWREAHGLKGSNDAPKEAEKALDPSWFDEVLKSLETKEALKRMEDLYNIESRMKLEKMITDKDVRMRLIDPMNSILKEGDTKKYLGFEPIKKGSPQMNRNGGRLNR